LQCQSKNNLYLPLGEKMYLNKITKGLVCLLIVIIAPFLFAQSENQEEEKIIKKTYVEALVEFFTKGKVIELSDFPETEVFEEFLQNEAKHKGLSIDELKERMRQTGITSYLLNLLKERHISQVEFANLMDISWIQSFQMAYSAGILEIPDESLEIMKGKTTETINRVRKDKAIIVEEIAFPSSIEELYPLYAEIAYDPKLRNMPILVYQHGDYPGTRLGCIPLIYQLAKNGIFGIAVSKRGRDGSAGNGDSFGKETYDIYDAVEYVKKQYAEYINPDNINITGGSAGGMDTFSAVVHFPDYFRVAAPFVGTPDLGHWVRQLEPTLALIEQLSNTVGGIYEGTWSLISQIIEGIGGLPKQVPDNYLARNWVLGAINNPYTLIHIFWDAEDGAAPSITERSKAYFEETKKMGYTNVHLHFSKKGDKLRFLHWGVPDNTFIYHYFLPTILSKSHPAPVLADAGRLHILGFIKTKKFLILLGEGNDAVARVDYFLSHSSSTFYFRRLSKDITKKGKLIYENASKDSYQVSVNNQIIIQKTNTPQIEVLFGLDDRVILKKNQ